MSGRVGSALTRRARSWDNTIQVVDTLLPNKTDVLPYLSGTGSKPDRYAKAIIWFGASEEPWLQEFQVRLEDFAQ